VPFDLGVPVKVSSPNAWLSCPIVMVGFQPLDRRVQISGPDGSDDITDRVVTDLLDHLLAVILDIRVLLDKPMQRPAMTTNVREAVDEFKKRFAPMVDQELWGHFSGSRFFEE
jgi:hypothetical protein